MVACIVGTTRSAFSMRSTQRRLSPSCWAIARNLLDVPLDISGNELTVSTHPALEIDKLVGMADATDALSDLLAVLREALVLTTGRFECLRGVLQAHGGFWGPARTALFGLVTCALLVSLHPFELFHGFSDGLVCSPLFRGHGSGDGFDQFVLYMEQVRCMVRFEIMCHIGQQPRRFIAGRLDHPAIELCQGRRHEVVPSGLITGLSQLFQNNEIALRVHRDEAKAAGKRFILSHREVFVGHVLGQAYGFIVALGHHRWFHVDIDLRLSPRGGRHNAVETRQMQEETHQANAACPDFDTDQMESHHDAV